ncbi:MAG: hypothetical protein QOF59_2914 [Actinomycetota bacterium]|nr:hypothetical protein [Actinomycetota bacterium]
MSDALDWNAKTIAEFRTNDGRVGGNFEGAPMILLHHRGRKSGREYVNPIMYLPHDTEQDIIYVFATKAGAPGNPDWYHNLTTAGDGNIERGTETYEVTVRELTGGERDHLRRASAALSRLRRVCAPNRRSSHHSCARTYAGVAHVPWDRAVVPDLFGPEPSLRTAQLRPRDRASEALVSRVGFLWRARPALR